MSYIRLNNKIYKVIKRVSNHYEVESDHGPFYIFLDNDDIRICEVDELEDFANYTESRFDNGSVQVSQIKTDDFDEIWVMYEYDKHNCIGLNQFRLGILTDAKKNEIYYYAKIDLETDKVVLL